MWLKKTSAKTKNGTKTYLQIMETIYENGKTRQKVIASLGNIEDVDIKTAESLVRSLNRGTYDSLRNEEISLLKPKKYGEILLLEQIYELSSMQRFLNDIAFFNRIDTSIESSIFGLIAYYAINMDIKKSFYEWIEEYYVPNVRDITDKTIVNTFELFQDDKSIKRAISKLSHQVQHRDRNTLNFIITSINKTEQDKTEKVVLLTTTTRLLPLNFSIVKNSHFSEIKDSSSHDIFVCDNINLIKKLHNKCNNHRYVYMLQKEDLNILFDSTEAVKSYVRGGGYFEAFENIGYKVEDFEGKKVIVLKPTAGYVDESNSPKEPRDILVTNLEVESEHILRVYNHLNKLGDLFYDIYLPKDLQFLYNHFSEEYISYFILNILYLNLLLENMLKVKLLNHNMSVEEAKNIVRNIQVAEIKLGNNVKHFHSKFNEEQKRLLSLIGVNRHLKMRLS